LEEEIMDSALRQCVTHNALAVKQFLADKCIPALEHPPPPHSPNLAPCDFHLFPKLKSGLKGIHFQYVDEEK
jgi:hypothetical protein